MLSLQKKQKQKQTNKKMSTQTSEFVYSAKHKALREMN